MVHVMNRNWRQDQRVEEGFVTTFGAFLGNVIDRTIINRDDLYEGGPNTVFRSHCQWHRPKPQGQVNSPKPLARTIKPKRVRCPMLWPPVDQQFGGIYDRRTRFLDQCLLNTRQIRLLYCLPEFDEPFFGRTVQLSGPPSTPIHSFI